LLNATASSCQSFVKRVIVAADRPAPEPRNCSTAGPKPPLDGPVQVQQWQHLGHLRRFARPGRQDRPGTPLPLPGHRTDTLVVDPRRTHRDRARRRGHLPPLVMTVADDQPPTRPVDLVGEHLDVGGNLGLQRGGQHLPNAVADDLIKQRPTSRLVGRLDVVDYPEHERTFPNQRANAAPDQSSVTTRSSSGRYASSRSPVEGHPQVLIIA
jgi:hypothetical protein